MIKPTRFSVFENQPVIHANSTRSGGVSISSFSTLNMGLGTNDEEEKVRQNRTIFFDHFNVDPKTLVFPQQVHSDHVEIVNYPGKVKNCDALITSSPELVLTIQTADCFPLFLYDPAKHICAIIHSGWRGTAKNITAKTISTMQQHFGSESQDLLVAVGAGIQQKNYQVDSVTAANFPSRFLKPDGAQHFKLNVQKAITGQLLEKGVKKENIEIDKTCTFEVEEKYFSYRRDGNKSGRMMGFIGLKKI